MPHFTLPLSPQGAVVDAAVMVSFAKQDALKAEGQSVPNAIKIRALIDTGASISAVDPEVLTTLALTQTGEADIHTPSTGGTPVQRPTYDVVIGIYAGRPGDLHFISDTVQVTGSELKHHGFNALIGTDILRKCILYYNGDGYFSLSY